MIVKLSFLFNTTFRNPFTPYFFFFCIEQISMHYHKKLRTWWFLSLFISVYLYSAIIWNQAIGCAFYNSKWIAEDSIKSDQNLKWN